MVANPTNNRIEDVGREYFTGVGIRVFRSADFVIANNEFSGVPYSAVSLGWGHNTFPTADNHRRNAVVANRFEHLMETLYDGSAVYLLGPAAAFGDPISEGTRVAGNVVDYSTSATPDKLPGDTVDPRFVKRPACSSTTARATPS